MLLLASCTAYSIIEPGADYGKANELSVTRRLTRITEGCFKNFQYKVWHYAGRDKNSNDYCQKYCRLKGYVVAGTRNSKCYCGNDYPAGLKINDKRCNRPCNGWTKCNGPQECCGGRSRKKYYSISVVGDIDTAREILGRLQNKWNTNKNYREFIMREVNKEYNFPKQRVTVSWWGSMDDQGWSYCTKNSDGNLLYLNGLWRDRSGAGTGLMFLEEADCREHPFKDSSQECHVASWWASFDRQGWSMCGTDHFMSGLWRGSKLSGDGIFLLEEAKCCRPTSVKWGNCIKHSVVYSFDSRGWSNCPEDYYMTGLYRSSCHDLQCIEYFKCCKMERKLSPTFTVIIDDPKTKVTKECTLSGDDYKRKNVQAGAQISLATKEFVIEDKSELNVARPSPIEHFTPIICSSSPIKFDCEKGFAVEVSKHSAVTVGAGFNMGFSFTSEVELSSKVPMAPTTTFSKTISGGFEFYAEYTNSTTTTFKDNVQVKAAVPAHTEVKIDVKRVTQDLLYVWKGIFVAVGTYTIGFGDEKFEFDITSVLTGHDRHFYALGKWEYPGTDFHKVIVTTGNRVSEKNCDQIVDSDMNCNVNIK